MMQGITDAQYEAQYLQMEQHILKMGNEILAALNADDVVTDVQIFQMDVFYIQIFQEIFGQELGLTPGQTPEQMAENIDLLLNMIEESLPEINIETLNGDMIVEGDFSQIIMMLELIAELVRMIDPEEEEEEEEHDQNKKLEDQVEEELQKKQQELMKKNDANTNQGRGGTAATMHGDPRELRKARKQERMQKGNQSNQSSKKISPEKPKNPLDQFSQRNKKPDLQNNPQLAQLENQPQLNQFGIQPQLNQFGNQPQLNQFGNQPQLSQFGNQPQLSQFGNQPQLSQFGGQPQLSQFNSGMSQFQPFQGRGLVPFGQVSAQAVPSHTSPYGTPSLTLYRLRHPS
jgi:hypothetical protein